MIEIRKEEQSDSRAIHQLNMAAFDNGPEADLVDKFRTSCKDYLSFVAVEDDSVVGHILFTPVSVEGCTHSRYGFGANGCIAITPKERYWL